MKTDLKISKKHFCGSFEKNFIGPIKVLIHVYAENTEFCSWKSSKLNCKIFLPKKFLSLQYLFKVGKIPCRCWSPEKGAFKLNSYFCEKKRSYEPVCYHNFRFSFALNHWFEKALNNNTKLIFKNDSVPYKIFTPILIQPNKQFSRYIQFSVLLLELYFNVFYW